MHWQASRAAAAVVSASGCSAMLHLPGSIHLHATPTTRRAIYPLVVNSVGVSSAGRYIEDLRKHTKAIQDGRLAHDNEGIKASLKHYGAHETAVVPGYDARR